MTRGLRLVLEALEALTLGAWAVLYLRLREVLGGGRR
jgi:hypothetical protein